MPTSGEMRAAAWRRLGSGAWLCAICGFAILFMLGLALETLLERVGLSQGWIERKSVVELLDVLVPEGGIALPEGLDGMTVNIPTRGYQAFMLFARIAFWGILAFGAAVLSVSVMRGAANAQQVLCGFRRPFKTAALGLLVTVRVFLWSLLFVVPGFCAWYSYRMGVYLLADNPDWSPSRALAESKRMMYGHRMRLAYLDASFIGWWLLVVVTFGLARVFVEPYMATANAAFYEDLLDRMEPPDAAEASASSEL